MTTKPFAQGTKISKEKTMEDLQKLLSRYGVEDFANMESGGRVHILFSITGGEGEKRSIRFSKEIPTRESLRTHVKHAGNGTHRTFTRTDAEINDVREAERRRIYRALSAIIKARLIAIDEDIQPLEQVFYPETVAHSSGATVYEMTNPRLTEGLKRGQIPSDLMPHLPAIENRAIFAAIPSKEDGD